MYIYKKKHVCNCCINSTPHLIGWSQVLHSVSWALGLVRKAVLHIPARHCDM